MRVAHRRAREARRSHRGTTRAAVGSGDAASLQIVPRPGHRAHCAGRRALRRNGSGRRACRTGEPTPAAMSRSAVPCRRSLNGKLRASTCASGRVPGSMPNGPIRSAILLAVAPAGRWRWLPDRLRAMSRTRQASPASSNRATAARLAAAASAIDALRGAAVCAMIAYHFAFDLNWFGVFRADFNHDLLWLSLRAMIVSSFMLLVGISLVLAEHARDEQRTPLAAHRGDRAMRAPRNRGSYTRFPGPSLPLAFCTPSRSRRYWRGHSFATRSRRSSAAW